MIWSTIVRKVYQMAALSMIATQILACGAEQSTGHIDRLAARDERTAVGPPAQDTRFYHVEPPLGAIGFDDVVGATGPKQVLKEFVASINEPNRHQHLGVRPAKGVLLVGDPGVGKTLLARATAQASQATFLVASGADLLSGQAGGPTLASPIDRVKELFRVARSYAPAIVFIDEMDALASFMPAAKQLGIELDGFSPSDRIYVIATLNDLGSIPASLKRPGRFDHVLQVELPKRHERLQLLEKVASPAVESRSVDLPYVARMTEGLSGAALVHLANLSAITAARSNAPAVSRRHWELAFDEMLIGPSGGTPARKNRDCWRTAVHESGHALVALMSGPEMEIRRVTIEPFGLSLGHTSYWPVNATISRNRSFFIKQIATALGGRAAEALMFGEASVGVSDDLRQATAMARSIVTQAGMGQKTGPQNLGYLDAMNTIATMIHGEKTLQHVDDDTKELVEAGWRRAHAAITQEPRALEALAEHLLVHIDASGSEVMAIVAQARAKSNQLP